MVETIEFKHEELTQKIIKSFYTIYNSLGYGFLEKVYRNAMAIEIQRMGLQVVPESKIEVYYQDQIVGEYFADLLIEDTIVVELKAASALTEDHKAQLLNYLKSTPYEVGLLLNFGPKPEIVRKAYDNTRNGSLKWLSPHHENPDHPANLRS